MDSTTTTFMSFNTTGLDSVKVKFSLDICNQYDVNFLSIQEHFKYVNPDRYFKSKFVNFSSYVLPGHRSPEQLTGRAKAGLAQLCSNKYEVKKIRVSSSSFRIQAQVLEFSTSKV